MTSTFSYEEFTTRNIGFISSAEQEKLRNAHVFVAGVGGMGGAAVACLARCGIGALTIADLDTFELSNLNRQIFASLGTVGQEKTAATKEAIANINPECKVTTLGAQWVEQLADILPSIDVAINGCDDVRATLALMRAGKKYRKTIVDAFASTLPNVYVARPDDPRPEDVFQYPSRGIALNEIDDTIVQGCARKEAEWVLTHSSTADFVELEIAGEVVSGTRPRISFAPMVWMTGCLMVYEVIREILDKPKGTGPEGVFYNPWTAQAERPQPGIKAKIKGVFVRRFLDRLTEPSQ